jgi:protein arginine N-methyltransferase 1
MGGRVGRAADKALRSTLGFAAARVASSDRLMSVVYDLMNETNFAGLSEHEEMLSDSVRVQAYHRGIHRNVRPGDVVVDLGTGTGLLAFMASRAGARKVYAVEHSDTIEIAREIGKHNGFTNIDFVQANSREFTPPEPVDVVVHEQMGDELFNENMLQNLLDVRDRFLRPHGRILPAKFRLYIEPVTLHHSMRVRRFWNIELPDGIDLGPMRDSHAVGRFDTGRNEQIWLRPGSVAATFGAPAPILEIDLDTIADARAVPTDFVVERTASADMIVDGTCIWFEALFDDDTVLSTSPLGPITSWGNRLYRLDREFAKGEPLRVDVHMGRLTDPDTWMILHT